MKQPVDGDEVGCHEGGTRTMARTGAQTTATMERTNGVGTDTTTSTGCCTTVTDDDRPIDEDDDDGGSSVVKEAEYHEEDDNDYPHYSQQYCDDEQSHTNRAAPNSNSHNDSNSSRRLRQGSRMSLTSQSPPQPPQQLQFLRRPTSKNCIRDSNECDWIYGEKRPFRMFVASRGLYPTYGFEVLMRRIPTEITLAECIDFLSFHVETRLRILRKFHRLRRSVDENGRKFMARSDTVRFDRYRALGRFVLQVRQTQWMLLRAVQWRLDPRVPYVLEWVSLDSPESIPLIDALTARNLMCVYKEQGNDRERTRETMLGRRVCAQVPEVSFAGGD